MPEWSILGKPWMLYSAWNYEPCLACRREIIYVLDNATTSCRKIIWSSLGGIFSVSLSSLAQSQRIGLEFFSIYLSLCVNVDESTLLSLLDSSCVWLSCGQDCNLLTVYNLQIGHFSSIRCIHHFSGAKWRCSSGWSDPAMRRVIILVHLPRTNQVVFNCSSFKSVTSSCNNLYFCSCMQVLYLFAVFAGDITVRVMYANY